MLLRPDMIRYSILDFLLCSFPREIYFSPTTFVHIISYHSYINVTTLYDLQAYINSKAGIMSVMIWENDLGMSWR